LRFGVDNYSKTPESRKICRENFIRDLENQKLNGETLHGRIGYYERSFLDELQKICPYQKEIL
jgi:hypothetical protein